MTSCPLIGRLSAGAVWRERTDPGLVSDVQLRLDEGSQLLLVRTRVDPAVLHDLLKTTTEKPIDRSINQTPDRKPDFLSAHCASGVF